MRDGGGRSAAADPASARADTGNLEARKPSPSPEPAAATAPPRAPRKPKVVTAATRSLTIGFKKAAGSLHGRLGSPRDVCSARRVVRIMRRTPGADDVVGMRRTAASGWWTMHRPHADGTFYLLIAKAERRLPEGGRVVCGAVRSTPFTRHVPAPEPVAPDTANPAEPSTSVDTPSTNVAPVAPPPTPPAPTGPNPGGSVESAIEKAKDLW